MRDRKWITLLLVSQKKTKSTHFRCGVLEAIICVSQMLYGIPHELLKDLGASTPGFTTIYGTTNEDRYLDAEIDYRRLSPFLGFHLFHRLNISLSIVQSS